MKAASILNKRVADADGGFAEYVVWLLPHPLLPSAHPYKYRLAYVKNQECVVRYDTNVVKVTIDTSANKKDRTSFQPRDN